MPSHEIPVYDWRATEQTRATHAANEFMQGTLLRNVDNMVTVFGSARPREGDGLYEAAYRVGYALGRSGHAVATGGGPGVMEAANKGAYDAGAVSIGCSLTGLPNEQTANPYTSLSLTFDHFYARKTAMVRYSTGFVIMPGGFGTLDEMFEVLTLIQTEKSPRVPVALYDSEWWDPLLRFLEVRLTHDGLVDRSDTRLFVTVDSPDEVLNAMR